jgi:hypothetical protein
MSSYLENVMVTLNSGYGSLQNGTKKSNINFRFTGLLKEESDLLKSYISISNAQIPVSYYTINDTNNYFLIKRNTGIFEAILIPFGNYNSDTLISTIKALWLLSPTGVGNPINITISATTGKLTFSFATSATITIQSPSTFISTGLTNYTYLILGLNKDQIYTSPASITSDYPLNLLGVKRLSIKSQKLSVANYSSITNGYTDTIATIPSDVAPYNMISYYATSETQKSLIKENNIDLIYIQIVDEYNNFIDFNNQDWTITMILTNERIVKPKDLIKMNDITSKLGFEFVNKDNSIANDDSDIRSTIEEKPLTKDEEELKLLES